MVGENPPSLWAVELIRRLTFNPNQRTLSMNSERRKILKAAAATAIAAPAAKAATGKSKSVEPQKDAPQKKVHYAGCKKPERKPGAQPPLFNGSVSYGNLLFIAGKGAHFKGDIKEHTKHVLDEIEKELV